MCKADAGAELADTLMGYEEFMSQPRTKKQPTREEIEREIDSLTRTINAIPVHKGIRLSKRVAELKRQLAELS